jgi:CubicO group peptidase (beta-lactamase class C family)
MTTDHLMEIASLTKTMTGIVIMQLVNEGKISLDDRVIKYPFHRWFYPVRISPEVRLRHVLSHTSQGDPGETYYYQGNRFVFVYGIFGTATSESYEEAITRRILDPLHMEQTYPRSGIRMSKAQLALLATPYEHFDSKGEPIPENPPKPQDPFPSAGFFSNVKDLTVYARALEKHSLLPKKSHDLMESPAKTRGGTILPYGIGWFSQTFAGEKLLWHYGYGNGSSALLLRVPSKKVTLIILANSANMSGSTRLGYGNVLDSPFAIAFLKHFVFMDKTPYESPPYDKEVTSIRTTLNDLGAKRLHPLYFHELFSQAVIRELMAGPNRDSGKALELLRILQEFQPQFISESGLTGLEVLSRFDDKRLHSSTKALSQSLLRVQPSHPVALFYSAQYFEKIGQSEESIRYLQQLADSEFVDNGLTLDACIKMGDHFANQDSKKASNYYWRAVQIGWASGSPRSKVDRAIQLINALDRR